jgi:hypothetical protein
MRQDDTRALQRVQLLAGRHGLKLVKNRHRSSSQGPLYCLRAIWNAACVVAERPHHGLGLVYAQTGRQGIAAWWPLAEAERVLASWSEPVPRAWGVPPSKGCGLPYSDYRRPRRRAEVTPRLTSLSGDPHRWSCLRPRDELKN